MNYIINNTKTKEEMYNMICKIFEDVIKEPMMSVNEYLCWKVYVFFNNGLSFMCMMNENEKEDDNFYYGVLTKMGIDKVSVIAIQTDTLYDEDYSSPGYISVLTNDTTCTQGDWDKFYPDGTNHCEEYFLDKFITGDKWNLFINFMDREDFQIEDYI